MILTGSEIFDGFELWKNTVNRGFVSFQVREPRRPALHELHLPVHEFDIPSIHCLFIGLKMELFMKIFFSSLFLFFTAAQTSIAGANACRRAQGPRDGQERMIESVYCENTAQSNTRCIREFTGDSAIETYVVTCSDNGGPSYEVSDLDLTAAESQRLLDKIELQIQRGQ